MNENTVCSNYESEINFCPSGSSMNVHYKNCPEDHHVVYECLGNWKFKGHRYMALIENTVHSPIYRCAVSIIAFSQQNFIIPLIFRVKKR